MKKLRISIQILVFLFTAATMFLLSYPPKLPSLNFFLASPSMSFLAALSSVHLFKGLILCAVFIIGALLFGRAFCGWLCPFGAVMDFAAFIFKPFRKWTEKEPSKALFSKYILLTLFFIAAVLGFQFVWYAEPITIFSRFLYMKLFPALNFANDIVFEYLIMNFNIGSNLYSFTQNFIFDARLISFNHSTIFLVLFVVPIIFVLFKKRFWCRYICPLGASLGILSVKAPFGVKSRACMNACGKCKNNCPTNAIRQDATIIKSECIMCMNCVPLKCKRPVPTMPISNKETDEKKGITRKQFLYWGAGIASAIVMIGKKNIFGQLENTKNNIIRPPGALPEPQFKQACVRCGNCMKICITNGLQPSGIESGFDGIWTPKMDAKIGYCEYNCNACGQACPTEAIKPLSIEEKQQFKMGQAIIQKDICIPWATGVTCLVCEEMCPIPSKAIKFVKQTVNDNTVDAPEVSRDLCIGCGICQNKCPVEGLNKGIKLVKGQKPQCAQMA
ncbi:MAG: 4Fe-4S binding protein [Elusimicrobiota bacterium]|jgi:MauM/NapG family ferredoxin protein|nr:4Fe-4S binding protein [Elusimicrobiota bacterium]